MRIRTRPYRIFGHIRTKLKNRRIIRFPPLLLISDAHRGASLKWKHAQNTKQASPRTTRAVGSRADTCPASPTEGIRPNFHKQFAINLRVKRFRRFSRAPIACARQVGARCIFSDLQMLNNQSKSTESFDIRKSQYPCRRYRHVADAAGSGRIRRKNEPWLLGHNPALNVASPNSRKTVEGGSSVQMYAHSWSGNLDRAHRQTEETPEDPSSRHLRRRRRLCAP